MQSVQRARTCRDGAGDANDQKSFGTTRAWPRSRDVDGAGDANDQKSFGTAAGRVAAQRGHPPGTPTIRCRSAQPPAGRNAGAVPVRAVRGHR